MNDATTAFLAFATVALGLGLYMWHLESRARRLETRLARLEPADRPPLGKPRRNGGSP